MNVKELEQLFIKTLSSFYPREEIKSFFRILIRHHLKLEPFMISLEPELRLTKPEMELFFRDLHRLEKEEPIQYITGETTFYGMTFIVSPDVLIPRPETEELVSWIIEDSLKETEEPNQREGELRVLDIGTGSGCIAISLATRLKNAHIYALDISEKALEIAGKNAKLLDQNIELIHASILEIEEVKTKVETITGMNDFGIIVSNPPYVRLVEAGSIKKNVLENEPHLALFVDDDNPLQFYDSIADFAVDKLSNEGVLYMEINQYLGEKTVKLFKEKGFSSVQLKKDIAGNDRMIKVQWH